MGIRAVCIAPSLGNMMMLTVNPHKPQIPPSHAHQGRVENKLPSILMPPFSQKVTISKNMVPTENETNEAIKGEITDCRSRELAAV